MKWISFFSLLFAFVGHAFQFSDESRQAYLERNGNEKALAHLECILDMTKHKTFEIKESSEIPWRCAEVESGTRQISVNNHAWAVIVDYTQPSNQRRFYLFNLDGTRPSPVVSFYVGHGRNGSTSRGNTTPRPGSNTILEAKYFSNIVGSNAPSSGFYITGHDYVGLLSGPSGKERSLAVHGLEKGINDNACDRTVVMHGSSNVKEAGGREGVTRMSSGCFIVDYDWVTELARRIRGAEKEDEIRKGGVPFFVYGPREAELPADYYCSEQAQETVRFHP